MHTSRSTTTNRTVGRVVVIGAGPGGMSTALACHRVGLKTQLFERIFHYTPKLMQPLRDLMFDYTPFLQKVIGDATPGHILKQLAEIDDEPLGPRNPR